MNHNRVVATLKMINKTYSRIIEPASKRALEDAQARITTSKTEYDNNKSKMWGYEISPASPLRFVSSNVTGYPLVVDIFCKIYWSDSDLPIQQDIKLRVWSKHSALTYRPELDAAALEEKIRASKTGRVMARVHFDKVDHSQGKGQQYHPHYHFQIGGKPEDDELCWHSRLDVPRIPYFPMELFLVCQMVAANFFPEFYVEVRKKAEWKQELLQYQNLMVKPYFKRYLGVLEENGILLDELQNAL